MTKEIKISEKNLIELMTYWSEVVQHRDTMKHYLRKLEQAESITSAAKSRFWEKAEELYPEVGRHLTTFEEDEGKFILKKEKEIDLNGYIVEEPLPGAPRQSHILYQHAQRAKQGLPPKEIEITDDCDPQLKGLLELFNKGISKLNL